MTLMGEPGSLQTAWRVYQTLTELSYTQVGAWKREERGGEDMSHIICVSKGRRGRGAVECE